MGAQRGQSRPEGKTARKLARAGYCRWAEEASISMDLALQDKVAIVGGASKGLGRACAEVLAQEGTKVAIWAVAHLLLRPIWKVLHQKVRYIEHGLQEWQSASHSEA